MEDLVLVAVDVPQIGDDRHKNWAKVVESVDSEKSSGWAYQGDFVATGGIQDVPAGSVLLVYGERGSRASPRSAAQVFVVNPDGTLTFDSEAKGQAWARTLRDPIERLLGSEYPLYDLSTVPDDVLVDEIRLRGWTVER